MRSLSLHRSLLIGATAVLSASCLKATANGGKPGTGGITGSVGAGGAGNVAAMGNGGTSPSGNGNDNGGLGGTSSVVIITGTGASGATGGSGTGTATGTGGSSVVKIACGDDPNQRTALPYTTGYQISASAKSQAMSAVASMTTTQLANQLRGTSTGQFDDIFRSIDDDGIKGFQFSDGPRGVNLDAVKPVNSNGYSTVFPAASARGATFDVDLENKVGIAMGDELIAAGRTMLLAPTVNILRHPAWGRSEETYGEDNFLLGRLGSAFVQGAQTYAPACVKHYAANNIEQNRQTDVAQMDEQTLQEVYSRHYGMIVEDGGVSCVMAAYNLIQAPPNGTALNCTQNKQLLTDILRNEYGFQGMVLSDWWAMPDGSGAKSDVWATNSGDAINAGLDMELPWNLNFARLESIVPTKISGSQLSAAALHVVTEKFRFNVNSTNGSHGLATPTTSFNSSTFSITNNAAHIALAEQAAEESMVLLQNKSNTLPIPSSAKTVAVVGLKVAWSLQGVKATGAIDFPSDARIGDLGSSRVNMDPSKAIGPFAGIKAAAPTGVNVVIDDTGGTTVAQSADFVIVVAGLTPEDEGEEYTITPEDSDRDQSLALDGKHGGTTQNNYINKILALGKPTAIVLEGGSVIDVSSFAAAAPAIVMAWYPGQSGGTALGNLLFGKSNFSGKLPVTWPTSLSQEPPFSGNGSTGPASTLMSYYLGYRWFDNKQETPQYAFGHGLSYTSFSYSNLQVPCSTVTSKGVVKLQVDVSNTGTTDGAETVFVFVSWPSSAVATRAGNYKELKGFQRAVIPHGATARITVPIRVSDLTYYDTSSSSWKIENGPVKVMVGPSSDQLPLNDTFTVQN